MSDYLNMGLIRHRENLINKLHNSTIKIIETYSTNRNKIAIIELVLKELGFEWEVIHKSCYSIYIASRDDKIRHKIVNRECGCLREAHDDDCPNGRLK